MTTLQGKIAVVTGGSSGVGKATVKALISEGVRVTAVARNADRLRALEAEIGDGLTTLAGDASDPELAARVVQELRPDLVVLAAGVTPRMGTLADLDWDAFSEVWNGDVKASFHFIQQALTLPLRPGSTVVVVSSGAAIQGSPLSGGYAGAKHMLWLMAKYANGVAEQEGLGIRFQVVAPLQMIAGTGVGDAGSGAYAKAMGIEREVFLARFGVPMPPRQYGDHLVAILDDPQYTAGLAFGLKGDTGITVLEGEAA